MDAVPALLSLDSALALLTLTALEVVLGIDNIVFIAILTGRLPEAQQGRARIIGLVLAMVMRIILLFAIVYVMRLTAPLVTVPLFTELAGEDGATARVPLSLSGRDLILVFGGLFLIAKATYEIHHLMEGAHEHQRSGGPTASFGMVITQIALLDVVFSLDSVITAVGMARRIEVMVAAIVIANRRHDRFCRIREPVRFSASVDQDAGAGVPRDDRRPARGGRSRPAPAARIRVLRDGVQLTG